MREYYKTSGHIDKYGTAYDLPKWNAFGEDNTITHQNVEDEKAQAEKTIKNVRPSEKQVYNAIVNYENYKPAGPVQAVASMFQSITGASDETVESWYNNTMGAQLYYARHGSQPFDVALDHDAPWYDDMAGFFVTLADPYGFISMYGGASIGKTLFGGMGKIASGGKWVKNPKFLSAYGSSVKLRQSLFDKLKNSKVLARLKNKKNIIVDPKGRVNFKYHGRGAGQDALIARAQQMVERNSEHFGSWFGFTFGTNYVGALAQQKTKFIEESIEKGDPTLADQEFSQWDAIMHAIGHSAIEGVKGAMIGSVNYNMTKWNIANKTVGGRGYLSKALTGTSGKWRGSWAMAAKTGLTSPIMRLLAEGEALTAMHMLQGLTDWGEPKPEGKDWFDYHNELLATNVGIVAGFKTIQPIIGVTSRFLNKVLGIRQTSVEADLNVNKKIKKQIEENTTIVKDQNGKEVHLDKTFVKEISDKILEAESFLEGLKGIAEISKNYLKPYGAKLRKSVEQILKDPESLDTINKIEELFNMNEHRIRDLMADKKAYNKVIKEIAREEYNLAEDVKIPKRVLKKVKLEVESAIESALEWSGNTKNQKITGGTQNTSSKKPILTGVGLKNAINRVKSNIESLRADKKLNKQDRKNLKELDRQLKDKEITEQEYLSELNAEYTNITDRGGQGSGGFKTSSANNVADSWSGPRKEGREAEYGGPKRSEKSAKSVEDAVNKSTKKSAEEIIKENPDLAGKEETVKHIIKRKKNESLDKDHREHMPKLEGSESQKAANRGLFSAIVELAGASMREIRVLTKLINFHGGKRLTDMDISDITSFVGSLGGGSKAKNVISPLKKALRKVSGLDVTQEAILRFSTSPGAVQEFTRLEQDYASKGLVEEAQARVEETKLLRIKVLGKEYTLSGSTAKIVEKIIQFSPIGKKVSVLAPKEVQKLHNERINVLENLKNEFKQLVSGGLFKGMKPPISKGKLEYNQSHLNMLKRKDKVAYKKITELIEKHNKYVQKIMEYNSANLKGRLAGLEESYNLRVSEMNKVTPENIHFDKKTGLYYIDTAEAGFNVKKKQKAIIAKTESRKMIISKELYNDIMTFVKENGIKPNEAIFKDTQNSQNIITRAWKINVKKLKDIGSLSLDLLRNSTEEIQVATFNTIRNSTKFLGGVGELLMDFHGHFSGHPERTNITVISKKSYLGKTFSSLFGRNLSEQTSNILKVQKLMKDYGTGKISIDKLILDVNKILKLGLPKEAIAEAKRLKKQGLLQKLQQGFISIEGLTTVGTGGVPLLYRGSKKIINKIKYIISGKTKVRGANKQPLNIKTLTTEIRENKVLFGQVAAEILSNIDPAVKDVFTAFKTTLYEAFPEMKNAKISDIRNMYKSGVDFLKDPEGMQKSFIRRVQNKFNRYLREDVGIKKGAKTYLSQKIAEILNIAKIPETGIENPVEFAKNLLKGDTNFGDVVGFSRVFDKVKGVKIGKTFIQKVDRVQTIMNGLKLSKGETEGILKRYRIKNENLYLATERQLDILFEALNIKRVEYIENGILKFVNGEISDKDLSLIGKAVQKMRGQGEKGGPVRREMVPLMDRIRALGKGTKYAKYFDGLADKVERYTGVLAKHFGKVNELDISMVEALSAFKEATGQKGGFEWVAGNVVEKALANKRWKKVKDVFAVLADPWLAEQLLTATSKIKGREGELFIDVYKGGKYAGQIRELTQLIYDKNFNIRKDTVEGHAMRQLRDWYKSYQDALGEIAFRTLGPKGYEKFVKLYGPRGEKWLEAYGHRRIARDFKYELQLGKEQVNPLFNEQLLVGIKKILSGKSITNGGYTIKLKGKKVDVDKLSQKELFKLANQRDVTEGGDIFSAMEAAEQYAANKITSMTQHNINEVSASPLKSRALKQLDINYLNSDPSMVKRALRKLGFGEELSTYEIGAGAFDKIVGGYAMTMGRFLAALEFFPETVKIEGIKKSRTPNEILVGLERLTRGNKFLSKTNREYILTEIQDMLGVGNPDVVMEIPRTILGTLSQVLASTQLSALLTPGVKNVGAGQSMSMSVNGLTHTARSWLKIFDAAHRAEVYKIGGVGSGLRIFTENLPQWLNKMLKVPLGIGTTVYGEIFNRITVDHATTLTTKEMFKNIATGYKVKQSINWLKTILNLTDHQIKLFQKHGFSNEMDPSVLGRQKSFRDIKDPVERAEVIRDYITTQLKVRHLGVARTQGTTLKGFLPRFLKRKSISDLLLFKKMAYQATYGAAKSFKAGGSVIGSIMPLVTMSLGSFATGWMLEEIAHRLYGHDKKFINKDDDSWFPDLNRFLYLAFQGELFSIAGDIIAYSQGYDNTNQTISSAPATAILDVSDAIVNITAKALHPEEHKSTVEEILMKPVLSNVGVARTIDGGYKNLFKNEHFAEENQYRQDYYEFVERDPETYSEYMDLEYEGTSYDPWRFESISYGMRLIGLTGKEHHHQDWNPQKYKRLMKQSFRGNDFASVEKFEEFDRAMYGFFLSQIDEYVRKGQTDDVSAAYLAMNTLADYLLEPEMLSGYKGLSFRKDKIRGTQKIGFYPNEHGGVSPQILIPFNEDGKLDNRGFPLPADKEKNPHGYQEYLDIFGVQGPGKTGINPVWEYAISLLDEDPSGKEYRKFIGHIKSMQNKIDKMWTFYQTESFLSTVSLDENSNVIWIEPGRHEHMSYEDLLQRYELENVMWDGTNVTGSKLKELREKRKLVSKTVNDKKSYLFQDDELNSMYQRLLNIK